MQSAIMSATLLLLSLASGVPEVVQSRLFKEKPRPRFFNCDAAGKPTTLGAADKPLGDRVSVRLARSEYLKSLRLAKRVARRLREVSSSRQRAWPRRSALRLRRNPLAICPTGKSSWPANDGGMWSFDKPYLSGRDCLNVAVPNSTSQKLNSAA